MKWIRASVLVSLKGEHCVWLFQLATTKSESLLSAMKFIVNPFRTCEKIFNLMLSLVERIKDLRDDPKTVDDGKFEHTKTNHVLRSTKASSSSLFCCTDKNTCKSHDDKCTSTVLASEVLFCRKGLVPQRVLGADDTPLEQVAERLQTEDRFVRHQQDSGHLRLHQVRSAAQQQGDKRRGAGSAAHSQQGHGRHRNSAGNPCCHSLHL